MISARCKSVRITADRPLPGYGVTDGGAALNGRPSIAIEITWWQSPSLISRRRALHTHSATRCCVKPVPSQCEVHIVHLFESRGSAIWKPNVQSLNSCLS